MPPTDTDTAAAVPAALEDPFPRPFLDQAGHYLDGQAAADAAAGNPLYFLVAAGAVAVAAFGALAMTSLLAYSPALLAEHLGDEDRTDQHEVTDDLERHDAEYLTVALTYVAAGWTAGTWALQQAVAAPDHGWVLGAFVATMLLFAGSLPIAVTQARAERCVLAVRPAVRAGWWLLRWPLVLPLLALTRGCLHLLRIRTSEASDPAEVQKQVMAAVADSVTEDTLAGEERTWIGNIVALKDLQVSTVMRPRPDIVAFPAAMPLREAVQKAMEHGFSRYPVYQDRIDEIVGIFYVKDALRVLHDDGQSHAGDPVRTMLREPLFVPETMGVAQLLRRFQAGHLHMAIVLDEYGTTAGLVSVEDVLEQIVGDIGDEYDKPSDDAAELEKIQVVEAGRVLDIPARTTVAEVNRQLGTELPEEGDWETVAGLVISTCSRIPATDETVVIGDTEFKILAADERRILRLRVTALGAQPAEEPS